MLARKIQSMFVAGLCLSLVSGCGYLNRQFPNLNLPEPDVSTTTATATTGAVLGAGVGAIVGSTSGNAGEGLAIGAAGGAAVGALVGNEFENQEKVIEEQREVLARQSERISSQEREIEDLKYRSSDLYADENFPDPPEGNSPLEGYYQQPAVPLDSPSEELSYLEESERRAKSTSIVSKRIDISSLPVYDPNPRSKSFGKSLQPRARLRSNYRGNPNYEAVGAASTINPSLVPNREPVQKRIAPKIEPRRYDQEVEDVAPIQASFEEDFDAEEVNEPVLDVPPVRTAGVAPVEKKIEPVAPRPVAPRVEEKVVEKTAALPKSFDSTSCESAEGEANRAARSSSEADKLFYYRRAIRLCPSNAKYHIGAGHVYAAIGRKEDARFEFTKALDLDPDNADAAEQLQLLATSE